MHIPQDTLSTARVGFSKATHGSCQVKLCTDCRYPHLGRQLVRKMTQQLWSVQQRAAWYVLLLHDLHVPLLPTDTSWLA